MFYVETQPPPPPPPQDPTPPPCHVLNPNISVCLNYNIKNYLHKKSKVGNMELLIKTFMCIPKFDNRKEWTHSGGGGVGGLLVHDVASQFQQAYESCTRARQRPTKSGGGGDILKYGRCDTAPYMCDSEKNYAHPCFLSFSSLVSRRVPHDQQRSTLTSHPFVGRWEACLFPLKSSTDFWEMITLLVRSGHLAKTQHTMVDLTCC